MVNLDFANITTLLRESQLTTTKKEGKKKKQFGMERPGKKNERKIGMKESEHVMTRDTLCVVILSSSSAFLKKEGRYY